MKTKAVAASETNLLGSGGFFWSNGVVPLLVVVFSFASLQPCAAGCDTVRFRYRGPYATGGGALHVATADLNGDGNLDFIVPNTDSGVVIYYGDGAGGFPTSVTLPAGVYPHDVAVGDFNGDGRLDLAVAVGIGGGPSAGAAILLNNGDGTFSAPTIYRAEGDPSQIVTADLNHDGKLDLAVTDNMSGNVDILLGLGTGAFQAPLKFPGTATPSGIVVGDFNQDHKPDLAISNYGTQDVRILLGDGRGHFSTANTYREVGNCGEVSMGDFNHDGKPDLAVSVFNSGNLIAILLGHGDGSFTPGAQIPVGDASGNVAVDLDGDGNLDLAVATYSDNNVTVLLGDGTGLFPTKQVVPLSIRARYVYDVTTGDFNHDGRADLVTAGYGDGYSAVLMGLPCQ